MNFLEKIENAINILLLKIGAILYGLVPGPAKKIFEKFGALLGFAKANFKNLPSLILSLSKTLLTNLKTTAASYDYKAAFQDAYQKAMAQYKDKSPQGFGKLRQFFLMPFLIFGQWLKDLTFTQSVVLTTFSVASIFAAYGIWFNVNKIIAPLGHLRAPASVEEVVAYERPAYYKKQNRHLDITNLRLPVYIAKVNEIRSIDIDFTATVSTREAKQFLEKHEFQLRDHFILQIEPSIASFPLEEEGKIIIKEKILQDIKDFLKQNEINATVEEVEITYVLAN